MASLRELYKQQYNGARVAELRRVPQRHVSVFEALCYLVLPFILVMAGAMPSAALFLIPVILCMLYLLYRRVGIYLPIACVAVYGALSLSLNYDQLTVVYCVFLFVAFCGLTLAVQFDRYLVCVAIAALTAIFGALAGVGVVRLAEGRSIGNIAVMYVEHEREDPVIKYFARDHYEHTDPDPLPKLEPSQPGYSDAVITSFAEWAHDEFEYYIWYYCIHYGAVFAGAAYFFALFVNRRTSCCYDYNVTRQELELSTRCMGGVRIQTTPVADMSVPRSFLWAMALPAVLAGAALEFVGGYDAISSTFMHLFVTLPGAFACATVLAFFASLFNGRARAFAHVLLVLVGAAAVLFPFALFIMSIFGICDCIIDLRHWTKYIKQL